MIRLFILASPSMADAEKAAFEIELARHKARQEKADAMPDNIAHALDAAVTSGYAFLSVSFGQAETTSGFETAHAARLDRQIAGLGEEVEAAKADADRCRAAYNRARHGGALGIEGLDLKEPPRQAPVSLDEMRFLVALYEKLRDKCQTLERERQAAAAAAAQDKLDQAKRVFDAACSQQGIASGSDSDKSRRVFAQLSFKDGDSSSSSHRTKTTRLVHRFIRAPTLHATARCFQDERLENPALASFVFI
ncbi:hypothetical protein IW140_006466 [Coemansia sp. RSA 1813]|nr:hypothetical protein IW140_006466 [Coemansia sp. RSA 1813]